MRYTDRIKNLARVYPELSRVSIKTGAPRLPLTSIWISESALRKCEHESCVCSSPSRQHRRVGGRTYGYVPTSCICKQGPNLSGLGSGSDGRRRCCSSLW